MTKLILTLTIVATAAVVVPSPLAAGCAHEYQACLNDNFDLKGVAQILGDIECFARYISCVAAVL